MDHRDLTLALMAIVSGALIIVFRKFSVRTFMESRRDPSKALAAELQERITLLVGLLIMSVGCVGLIRWLL